MSSVRSRSGRAFGPVSDQSPRKRKRLVGGWGTRSEALSAAVSDPAAGLVACHHSIAGINMRVTTLHF